MSQIISDAFLIAAVIGGPLLLALFYVYGMNATRQLDKHPHSRDATERATKDLYHRDEEERDRQEKSAEKSKNLVDIIERKTGTTG